MSACGRQRRGFQSVAEEAEIGFPEVVEEGDRRVPTISQRKWPFARTGELLGGAPVLAGTQHLLSTDHVDGRELATVIQRERRSFDRAVPDTHSNRSPEGTV